MDQFDSTTYRKVSRRHDLSPLEKHDLRTGPKVSVMMGPPGNRFVIIEGAFANILKHHWTVARNILPFHGASNLCVPADYKEGVRWAYKYMLSDETDVHFPENQKLDQLEYKHLAYLYRTCEALGYESLATKVWNLLRSYILDGGCWDTAWANIKLVAMILPGMIDVVAESIMKYVYLWVFEVDQAQFIQYFEYLDKEVFADPHIGSQIRDLVELKRISWIHCSELDYSSQPSFNQVLQRAAWVAQRAKATCFACGGKGHMARACTASEKVKAAYQAWYKQQRAAASKAASKSHSKRPIPETPAKQAGHRKCPAVGATNSEQVSTSETPIKKQNIPAYTRPSYAAVLSAPVAQKPSASTMSATKAPVHIQVQSGGQASVAINSQVTVNTKGPVTINAGATGTVNMKPASAQRFASPKQAATMTNGKPAAPGTNTTRRPLPTCYNCGKTGHISRNCWKRLVR
jgi:hypothetical protein